MKKGASFNVLNNNYCRILDEKAYFTEYIESCVKENINAEQKAAKELYEICMVDGGEWLHNWVDYKSVHRNFAEKMFYVLKSTMNI